MPTKEIFAQLIKRAMQITDPISELNHLEAKTDPRKIVEGEKEEVMHAVIINDQIVASGVDPEFNALRVFPPAELEYPDIMGDGAAFYDKIGSMRLRVKYMPESVDEMMGDGSSELQYNSMCDLLEAIEKLKRHTTNRLNE